jgi:DNA-binding CsgD family transcriptional regulator
MIANLSGDDAEAERLGRAALQGAVATQDDWAFVLAVVLLRTLPTRPPDRKLPTLIDALAATRRRRDVSLESVVLANLASDSLSRGDLVATGRWVGQRLDIEGPSAGWSTLALSAAALVGAAARCGDHDLAAQLHGSIASVLPLIEAASPPSSTRAARRWRERVVAALGESTYARRMAEGAAWSVEERFATARAYARQLEQGEADSAAPVRLTPRELDVLRSLAQGRTNKAIAAELGITSKTVMHHVATIFRKLGVERRAAAASWAHEHGLLRDDVR